MAAGQGETASGRRVESGEWQKGLNQENGGEGFFVLDFQRLVEREAHTRQRHDHVRVASHVARICSRHVLALLRKCGLSVGIIQDAFF